MEIGRMLRIDGTAWQTAQDTIWACELCRDHKRVACNIRQQTEVPARDLKLLLVGIAPPYVSGVLQKTRARSATNQPDDNLRKLFILATIPGAWEDLLARGLFLIHSVKCAITVEDRHQNPPDDVVDACALPHFVQEVTLMRPPRVVVFGKAPYRALLKIPGVRAPSGLGVSVRVGMLVDKTRGGLELQADGWKFKVHVSPFPLERKKPNPVAQEVLREAAKLAGVLDGTG
jgi:uracil-DNA glycosylase